jgi:hypothetical protein
MATTLPFSIRELRISGIPVTASGNTLYVNALPLLQTSQTGSFITTGQTGTFAPAANTGNFITTGQTGVFALAASTGSFITTGQTGAFAPAAGTGAFITTGQTGIFQAALGFTPLNKVGDLSTGNYGFGRISGTNLSTFVKTVTGQYAFTTGDATVIFSGSNLTGTLPSASTVSGLYFDVKNIFGSTILSGTQAIEGVSGINLPLSKSVRVQSNGAVWWILNEQATGQLTGVFAQSSQTGNFITSSQTGAFAPAAGTGSFITTGQTGVFALSANTGSFITTGQTGIFALAANTGAFITTGQTGVFALAANTGNFITTGQTGVFALSSNTGAFITTGQTGAFAPAAGTGNFITTGQTGVFALAAGTGAFITTGQTGAFQAALGFTPLNKVGDTSTGNYTLGNVFANNYGEGIKTVTGQYSLVLTDGAILFSGNNLTGTLPSASTVSGYSFIIKNIFGSLVLSGTQAIDGSSGISISLNKAVSVVSDGTVWWVSSEPSTGLLTGVFAQSSQTGSFITTAQTGAFAPAAGTGTFITTGQTGVFALSSNTGAFITTGQTGAYLTGVGNLGAGSGVFSSIANNAGQLRSLVTGSGMIILGDANTLTLHTQMGNQFNSGLQANITLAVANSYSGIVSGNVGPGTWLVTAMLNARSTGNSAMRVTAKLWSGLGAFAAGEEDAVAGGANVTGHVCVTLTNIFTTTLASTPLVLSAASTFAGTVVLTGVQDNGLGTDRVGACTQIAAVRII